MLSSNTGIVFVLWVAASFWLSRRAAKREGEKTGDAVFRHGLLGIPFMFAIALIWRDASIERNEETIDLINKACTQRAPEPIQDCLLYLAEWGEIIWDGPYGDDR